MTDTTNELLGRLERSLAPSSSGSASAGNGHDAAPVKATPLGAEDLLKDVGGAATRLEEAATALGSEIGIMLAGATKDMEELIARLRELQADVLATRDKVRGTTETIRAFGERLNGEIAGAKELCRRFSAQCEAMISELPAASR